MYDWKIAIKDTPNPNHFNIRAPFKYSCPNKINKIGSEKKKNINEIEREDKTT